MLTACGFRYPSLSRGAVGRPGVERAQHVGDEQRRMPQVDRSSASRLEVAARFRIEQDRLDHGLQVAARRAAVAVEDGGDPGHVCRARIARHQVLNQLLRDERADVRIVEDVVDRVVRGPSRVAWFAGSTAPFSSVLAPMSCCDWLATIGSM